MNGEYWRVVARNELEGLFKDSIYDSYGDANTERTAVARRHGFPEWLTESRCYAYSSKRAAQCASIHHHIGEAGRVL
jgi:hypothetical protein